MTLSFKELAGYRNRIDSLYRMGATKSRTKLACQLRRAMERTGTTLEYLAYVLGDESVGRGQGNPQVAKDWLNINNED